MRYALWIAIALFAAAVAVFALNPFHESDSFYHLAAGRLITETKSIPHADVFSYTAEGAPWIAHEWLAELIFYGVFRMAGYWGVIVCSALLAAATYGILFSLLLKRGVPSWLAMAGLFGGHVLTAELWIGRPQIFMFLMTAVLLLVLHEGKRLWLAVPLVALWANLHGSFPFGIILIAWYGISAFSRKEQWRPFAWSAAFGALAGLLTPNGIHGYLYLLRIKGAVAALPVGEWQTILAYVGEWQVKAFLLLALLSLAFVTLAWRRGTRDVKDAGLVLAGSLLPLISSRYVGLWPLLALPPLLVMLAEYCRARGFSLSEKKGSVFGSIVFVLFLGIGIVKIPAAYANPVYVPLAAADFIEHAPVEGRIFNFYEHGGYFLWRWHGGRQVFIDGRSEVYAGRPIEEYIRVLRGEPGWQEVFRRYDIQAAVVPYQLPNLQGVAGRFAEALFREGWFMVSWDDGAVIFVNPKGPNRALIDRYALRAINPWTPPEHIPPEFRARAGEELVRLLEAHPESEYLREYARGLSLMYNQ